MIKQILPYGLATMNGSKLRKFIKNITPYFIILKIQKNYQKKKFTAAYLQANYVSDLTEREKWSLLAYLLLLEKSNSMVKYLEVGIYAGGTIKFLLEKTQKTNFTGVDLFEDFKPEESNTHLWQNYKVEVIREALNSDRLCLIKGDSVKVLTELDNNQEKFDLIFIDGNHTYKATKDDFEASINMLNKEGYVIFHNCSPGMTQEDKAYLLQDGGPWMLTEELRNASELQFEFEVDRLRVFKRAN